MFKRLDMSKFASCLFVLFLLLPVLPTAMALVCFWPLLGLAAVCAIFITPSVVVAQWRQLPKPLVCLLALFFLWVLFVNAWHGQILALLLPVFSIVIFLVFLVLVCDHKTLAQALFVAALLMAAVALFSLGWQCFVLERGLEYRSWRIGSSGFGDWANIGNPIDAALYFGFFNIVLLERISRNCSGIMVSVLAGLGIVCLSLYLFFTFSRGPIVAVYMVLVLLLCWRFNRRSIALFLVFFGGLLISCWFFESIWQSEIARGTTGRVPIWLQAWEQIKSSYGVGHGFPNALLYWPVAKVSYNFEHNWFLSVLVRYGVAALLLIVAVIGSAFYRTWQSKAANNAMLAAALLCYGVVGMQSYVDVLLRLPHFYWLLLWLPLGLVCGGSCKLEDKNC